MMNARNGARNPEKRPLKGVLSDKSAVPKTGTRLTPERISRLLGKVSEPRPR